MIKKIELKTDAVGCICIFSNGVNIGTFDQVGLDEPFAFFPKRNDKISGDDLISVGHELNKLNSNLGECKCT